MTVRELENQKDTRLPENVALSAKVLDLMRRQPLGAVGAIILLIMTLTAVFADVIAPFDPEINDFGNMLRPPGWDFLLGTDEFGRDILSRVIYGARTAMALGFIVAFTGSTLGLIIGVTSAYFGGWVDMIAQRFIDTLIAFPFLILTLALIVVMGRNTSSVIIALIVGFAPVAARVIRSAALPLREVPYVDAARALGFGHMRIILRHMLPNVMAPYLILLTGMLGAAILGETALSFLGVGVQEPTPAWGLMLQTSAEEYSESAPWMVIFPGLAISLAVFSFNMFGDSLRDLLDPKMRAR